MGDLEGPCDLVGLKQGQIARSAQKGEIRHQSVRPVDGPKRSALDCRRQLRLISIVGRSRKPRRVLTHPAGSRTQSGETVYSTRVTHGRPAIRILWDSGTVARPRERCHGPSSKNSRLPTLRLPRAQSRLSKTAGRLTALVTTATLTGATAAQAHQMSDRPSSTGTTTAIAAIARQSGRSATGSSRGT